MAVSEVLSVGLGGADGRSMYVQPAPILDTTRRRQVDEPGYEPFSVAEQARCAKSRCRGSDCQGRTV